MNDHWTEVSLGDLVELVPGRYIPKAEYVDDGPYFIYGSNSVMGKYSDALIREPHVVMAAIGAYAGAVRFSAEPSWVNNNAFGLVCCPEVEPYYLYLWLTSQLALEHVVAGTGQPYVQRPALKAVRVSLPSLAAQKRIVDLVGSVDAYIAGLERQVEAARTARNAVLHELLISGGEDWTVSTIGDLCEVNPESTGMFAPERDVTYIDLSSVSSDRGISTELTKGPYAEMPGRARRVVRERDVLVATVRPYLRGFALVPQSLDGEVASTGFTVLRSKPGVCVPEYIWNVVRTNSFVDYLMSRATGSSYPAVRPDDVASYSVSTPPILEQQRIVDLAASLDDVVRRTEDALAVSRLARKGLLSDLLSGEHEIAETYDKFLGAA